VRPEPPQQHHTTLWLSELRLLGEYGILSGFAVQAVVPFRLIRTDTEFTNLDGEPITLDYENIHHRDETLFGLGDIQLLGHLGKRLASIDFGLRLGVSLPTGKVHEDPYRLGDEGKRHQHIQFGTGTFDPVAGVDVSHAIDGLTLSTFGQAQIPIYEGPQGYQAGARFLFGATAAHRLGTKDFTFRVGFGGLHELAERWNGEVPTDDGNQGRTDLFAGPGITIALGNDWTFSFDARGRVYGHAKNAQLDLPIVLDAGIGTLFHLESGAHVDEPGGDTHGDDDHGGHADHGGHDEHADVSDVVRAGEARPLAGVPGKWTVFDFWATWCEACITLEKELGELAHGRPDLAVRRVNIVDFDSAISKQELKGVGELPHIRIVDPNGRTVWSGSGTPDVLMSEVEKRLPKR
jgi:thiol-disulfide isomerase/thioredoxin